MRYLKNLIMEESKMNLEEELEFFRQIKNKEEEQKKLAITLCSQNIEEWKRIEHKTIDFLFTKNPSKTLDALKKEKRSLLSAINILKGNRDREKGIPRELNNKVEEKREYYIVRYQELIEEIERQIEFFQKQTILPPRLQTNLTTQQRAQLFTELVDGRFIPNENQDCFNWAIAAKGETEPKQPGQWQPVKWKKSKSLLAYFVDVFNSEVLGNDGNNKRIQWQPFELLFGESGLRGSKNDYQKTGSLPNGYEQINILIRSLK
jgi:hypothetical protein